MKGGHLHALRTIAVVPGRRSEWVRSTRSRASADCLKLPRIAQVEPTAGKSRTGLKNPLICMTKIGVLDAARLSFGDLRPTDAYLCGSIKQALFPTRHEFLPG
jgi:hypothetical protein